MDSYDKDLKQKALQRKNLLEYILFSVFLLALLGLDLWIYMDLSAQKLGLLQQLNAFVSKGTWWVFGIFAIVSAIWYFAGKAFDCFEYKSIYPFVGVSGLSAVFLFAANNRAWMQCKQFIGNIWGAVYGVFNPVLFWILFAIVAIVLAFFNLDKVFDFVENIISAVEELFYLEGIAGTVVFAGCCFLYHFVFIKLLAMQSLWILVCGASVLAFVIYSLWGRFITKGTVTKDDMLRSHQKTTSITVRILRDIVLGMVASLAIYFAGSAMLSAAMEKWSGLANIKIIEFDVQEIFFTELSLVFLVISFVTLLANKTEAVYWVDVIQYRLVTPNYTSIVDISSYIFANLILSLIAYIFPACSKVMVVSFVTTIILLGFLSIKLLISFFGVDHLKQELRKKYQMALEYRKLVCQVYYELNQSFSFAYLPGSKKREENPYANKHLGEFGTRHTIETKQLQNMHDELLRDYEKRWKWKGETYRKLNSYAKKFNYRVDYFESMRDRLYTNTIRCIDEYKINDISEQILFLLQYKEYEYAIDCMKRVIAQCPMVFLELFNPTLNNIARDKQILDFFNENLQKLLSDAQGRLQLESTKKRSVVKYMANWVSGCVSSEDLLSQLATSAELDDDFLVTQIYRASVLDPVRRMILKEARNMQLEKVRGEELTYNNALPDEQSKNVIIKLLEGKHIKCAFEVMKEYKNFLDALYVELQNLPRRGTAYLQNGTAYEMEVCDLADIYTKVEDLYNKKETKMPQEEFAEFIKLIGICYKRSAQLYRNRYAKSKPPVKLQNYKQRLADPIIRVLQENDFEDKKDLLSLFEDNTNVA